MKVKAVFTWHGKIIESRRLLISRPTIFRSKTAASIECISWATRTAGLRRIAFVSWNIGKGGGFMLHGKTVGSGSIHVSRPIIFAWRTGASIECISWATRTAVLRLIALVSLYIGMRLVITLHSTMIASRRLLVSRPTMLRSTTAASIECISWATRTVAPRLIALVSLKTGIGIGYYVAW